MLQVFAFNREVEDWEIPINALNSRIVWKATGRSTGVIRTGPDNVLIYEPVIEIELSDTQLYYENKEEADDHLDFQGYMYAIEANPGDGKQARLFVKDRDSHFYTLTQLYVDGVFSLEDGYSYGVTYFNEHEYLRSIVRLGQLTYHNIHDYGFAMAILDKIGMPYTYHTIQEVVESVIKNELKNIQILYKSEENLYTDIATYDFYDTNDQKLIIFDKSPIQPFGEISDEEKVYITSDYVEYKDEEETERYEIHKFLGVHDYNQGKNNLNVVDNIFNTLAENKTLYYLGMAVGHIERNLDIVLPTNPDYPYVSYDTVMSYDTLDFFN